VDGFFCATTKIRLVRGCAAEINVEKQKAVIFLERDELWNVKACVVEEIELALKIEIKQTFRGAVRGDDTVAEAGFFGGLRQFGPILVAANFVAGREGNWEASAATGVFHFGRKDGVGELFRCEGRKFLAALVFEDEREANAAEIDANAVRGLVAQHDSDGEYAE